MSTKKSTPTPKAKQAPQPKEQPTAAQRILFATGEAMPFLRSGGLGDVAGALPKALLQKGIDCRVIMPMHSAIPAKYTDTMRFVGKTYVSLGWRTQYCGVFQSTMDGVTYYFIDNEYYFRRNTMYGQFDDAERFAFFSKAVLEALSILDFAPQIIHCNDWHTALIPVFLDVFYRGVPKLERVKTVFTIHNIEFQGQYDIALAKDICSLPDDRISLVEYGGALNYMKGGIECANAVTTVSPTYARELQEPFYAYGLDGILKARQYKISGIINGIDTDLYDPATDSALYANYSLQQLDKRAANKENMCQLLNLNYRPDRPLISMVTRLTTQKGLDLVLGVAEELLAGDLQLVVLGTGEWKFENAFKDLEHRYGAKLRVIINFNKDLASKLYASSDMFLMPSKFEPCGLSQMIAMRYGAVPIVRETGGLKDSVSPYDPTTGKGLGFTFWAYSNQDLLGAIWRAMDLYYNDQQAWQQLVRNDMQADFSWTASASQYADLYDRLLK